MMPPMMGGMPMGMLAPPIGMIPPPGNVGMCACVRVCVVSVDLCLWMCVTSWHREAGACMHHLSHTTPLSACACACADVSCANLCGRRGTLQGWGCPRHHRV
jgi:hypothetical protein